MEFHAYAVLLSVLPSSSFVSYFSLRCSSVYSYILTLIISILLSYAPAEKTFLTNYESYYNIVTENNIKVSG